MQVKESGIIKKSKGLKKIKFLKPFNFVRDLLWNFLQLLKQSDELVE